MGPAVLGLTHALLRTMYLILLCTAVSAPLLPRRRISELPSPQGSPGQALQKCDTLSIAKNEIAYFASLRNPTTCRLSPTSVWATATVKGGRIKTEERLGCFGSSRNLLVAF